MPRRTRPSRRSFLKTAAAASAAFPLFTVAGTKASGRVLGANDTIRVAVAGINGRGGSHLDAYTGMPGVQVVALADPDARLFESRRQMVRDRGGNDPQCVLDVRHVLDGDQVDAVSIATTNHWHSLITIWACQAGKDVYVEKPISHNVYEGRKCVEAAARHGRVVAHGTQRRSGLDEARQIAAVQSGKYGKLLVSKGYCCKQRWSIGQQDPAHVPTGLDFDTWLGPAAAQAYHGNLVHYNWHWFWDFGNGDIGNQGVHEMDVARWGIAGGTLPNRVWSIGGRFGYQDQGQTPNTLLSVLEFGEVLLVFETRGLVENNTGIPRKVGNEFYTTEGMIADGQFHPAGGGTPEPLAAFDAHVTDGGSFGSFIEAVRAQDPRRVNADAETAHYSSALCHLANISYRLGQPGKLDAASGTLGDNHEVFQAFQNVQDNLGGIGLNLADVTYQIGRPLTFDAATERFTGEDVEAANALLTREYREPFVVRDEV
jgi:predicted dehydrogenase